MTATVDAKPGRSSYLFAILRLASVALVAVAIVATFLDTASRATINPFNFFGFFTMQSNIITATVLSVAALTTFTGRPQTQLLMFARACTTTYIVIVGIVYNLLLAGTEGGIALEANWVLHVAFPIYAALDWILFGDRSPLPWKQLWVVLIYPAIWIVVVIIRGATDGWVPYPFLDPATGYGSVAVYFVVISLGTMTIGAIVFALSRVRIITP